MTEVQNTQPETPEEKKIRKAKEAVEEAEQERIANIRHKVVIWIVSIGMLLYISHGSQEYIDTLVKNKKIIEEAEMELSPENQELIRQGKARLDIKNGKGIVIVNQYFNNINSQISDNEIWVEEFIPCTFPAGDGVYHTQQVLDEMLNTCDSSVREKVIQDPSYQALKMEWTQANAINVFSLIRETDEEIRNIYTPYQTCHLPDSIRIPSVKDLEQVRLSYSTEIQRIIWNNFVWSNPKSNSYAKLHILLSHNNSLDLPDTIQIPSKENVRNFLQTCDSRVKNTVVESESWKAINNGEWSPSLSIAAMNKIMEADVVFEQLSRYSQKNIVHSMLVSSEWEHKKNEDVNGKLHLIDDIKNLFTSIWNRISGGGLPEATASTQ